MTRLPSPSRTAPQISASSERVRWDIRAEPKLGSLGVLRCEPRASEFRAHGAGSSFAKRRGVAAPPTHVNQRFAGPAAAAVLRACEGFTGSTSAPAMARRNKQSESTCEATASQALTGFLE